LVTGLADTREVARRVGASGVGVTGVSARSALVVIRAVLTVSFETGFAGTREVVVRVGTRGRRVTGVCARFTLIDQAHVDACGAFSCCIGEGLDCEAGLARIVTEEIFVIADGAGHALSAVPCVALLAHTVAEGGHARGGGDVVWVWALSADSTVSVDGLVLI